MEKHYNVFMKSLSDLIQDKIFGMSDAEQSIDSIVQSYEMILESAQSPIEKIMGARLLFCTNGYLGAEYMETVMDVEHIELSHLRSFHLYLSSQEDVGNYTSDFMFKVCVKGDFKNIAIECDGFDYHDRTKQQATKDKKRDRYFNQRNISVYRFTGSEIYKNVDVVAEEIDNILQYETELLLFKHGLISKQPEQA